MICIECYCSSSLRSLDTPALGIGSIENCILFFMYVYTMHVVIAQHTRVLFPLVPDPHHVAEQVFGNSSQWPAMYVDISPSIVPHSEDLGILLIIQKVCKLHGFLYCYFYYNYKMSTWLILLQILPCKFPLKIISLTLILEISVLPRFQQQREKPALTELLSHP